MASEIRITEVAQITGISEPTLRRWCAEKRIVGAVHRGKFWFMPSDEIKRLPAIMPYGKRSPNYRNDKRKNKETGA